MMRQVVLKSKDVKLILFKDYTVVLRILAGFLLSLWLLLVLIGKGGFIHLLLLNGIGVAVVEAVTLYRTRMKA